jgi:hypothetical protein
MNRINELGKCTCTDQGEDRHLQGEGWILQMLWLAIKRNGAINLSSTRQMSNSPDEETSSPHAKLQW